MSIRVFRRTDSTDSSAIRIKYPTNDPGAGYFAPSLEGFPDPYNFGQPTAIQNPFDLNVMPGVLAKMGGGSPVIQFRIGITPTQTLQDNYLVWRNGATQTGGCRDACG